MKTTEKTQKKERKLLCAAVSLLIGVPILLLAASVSRSYEQKYATYKAINEQATRELRNALFAQYLKEPPTNTRVVSKSNPEPTDWSVPLYLAGAPLAAYGVGFPVFAVILPWMYSRRAIIKYFFASRKNRMLAVAMFTPSALLLLFYAINGGDWPDDEVVTGSFIVGPLAVLGCIGIYRWIDSGKSA